MPKKESRRYTLKDTISKVSDKRLEGREGDTCYYGQSANQCLDNAQEDRRKGKYIGTDDSSFFGPFQVETMLGTTDTFCIIFED